jgi:predicted enzyme related to lactoylglutathione lyase
MAAIAKKPGDFCWTDIGTTDVAAAKKFYTTLFGWTVKDFPMGPGDEKYSMFRVRGKDVCGLYPMFEEQEKMQAPPSWLPYVLVKSADATAKKAKAAGGKIYNGPMDVMYQGRQAVIADPTGAVFALWQPRKHRGTQLDGKGAVAWHDLNTPKAVAAGKFYTKVFGWKVATQKYNGNKYHLLQLGKEGIGGIWPSPMKNLQPSWLTYWNVSNCAKTVAKAKRLRGRVLMGTTLVPEMVRFAVLADPQGGVFGVIEPLM